MATRKIKDIVKGKTYCDWNDVDDALRRLGEVNMLINDAEGRMTLQVNEIREDYDRETALIREEKAEIEQGIEDFAAAAKDEFLKTRTKTLTYGTIAYRLSTKIKIKGVEACIKGLKKLGLIDCVRVKEEPDREAMKNLDPSVLSRLGAELVRDDNLTIEPNIEKIKDCA